MNREHEAASKAIVERVCAGAFVCTSSEVLPEIREFERTSTTVANAYLGPKMAGYLTELADRLRGDGNGEGDGVARLDGELLVSHSGGGLMTVASARERPARICQSGPAAGVMGARSVADRLGLPNAISLDMGGTSADIAAITEGQPAFRSESHIEFNIPITYPAIDLVTIGAGGGTIAWIDATGALQSGPQSAGAEPGPVCYGRGGTQPTNTDANLVLGRLRANDFLGGRMPLDREAAQRAIADRIATPLGMTVEEAAAGMLRLSNNAMLNAIRLMTTQRGYDPREFALIAFGGAGGLHAADLAFDVGMERVVIPRLPGVISAQGILAVDVRHDLLEPLFQRASTIDAERVHAAIARLDDATESLKERDSSVERWHVERRVDVRYFGQISGYLTLPVPDGDPVAALREIADRFGERHEREFGYALGPEIAEVELVNLRSALIGEVPNPPQPAFVPAQATRVRDVIPVWFPAEAYLDTAYVDRDAIGRADTIEGPAIVTEWDSTTVVPPGATAVLAPSGELVVAARA